MKIEPLNSNSYRIRKRYKGKLYTVIVDYKPTQKEAMELVLSEIYKGGSSSCGFTLEKALDKYIEQKSNVLSPCTIRGYRAIMRALPAWFKESRVSDITSNEIQKCINEYAEKHSPKTVRNAHGLISALMGTFASEVVIRTTLPQKAQNELYMPTDNEVKQILNLAEGQIKVGLYLAALGLRRSEICADNRLVGNVLTIKHALVPDEHNNYVLKGTKTEKSARQIYLPDDLVELIKEHGMYSLHPNTMYTWLRRTQDKLGMPHFGAHMLRHYYASKSHSLGIPDSYIKNAGGWTSDYTMKKIYIQAEEDKKKQMQEKVSSFISTLAK